MSLCIAGILTHQSNRCAPAVFLKAHHSSDPLGPTQLLNSETFVPNARLRCVGLPTDAACDVTVPSHGTEAVNHTP